MGKNEAATRVPVPAKDQALPAAHRVNSTALIGPSRELIIEHNGREYRLRLTQNDKLILTA